MKILNGVSGQAILLAGRLRVGAKARKICAPARGRRLRDEHGNILVEIAISLPLLLLVFTGIFYFGIAYNNQLTLIQAVGRRRHASAANPNHYHGSLHGHAYCDRECGADADSRQHFYRAQYERDESAVIRNANDVTVVLRGPDKSGAATARDGNRNVPLCASDPFHQGQYRGFLPVNFRQRCQSTSTNAMNMEVNSMTKIIGSFTQKAVQRAAWTGAALDGRRNRSNPGNWWIAGRRRPRLCGSRRSAELCQRRGAGSSRKCVQLLEHRQCNHLCKPVQRGRHNR